MRIGILAFIVLIADCATPPQKPISVTPAPVAFIKKPLLVIAPTGSITIVPQSANIEWNASQDTDTEKVGGYNVYYGTETRADDDGTWPSPYPNVINVSNVTNYLVSGLSGATTYYFSVTAVAQTGDESDFSDEVAYQTPTVLDLEFAFSEPVTNVVLQSSTDLMPWQDLGTIPTNGTWRVVPDPSVLMTVYRGKAMSNQ